MFKKFLERIKSKGEPVIPSQGKRLTREEARNGDVHFEIKGVGRPGFFIIFGLLFGGPTSLIFLGMIFGTPSPEDDGLSRFFCGLFLLPFILIGAATFLTGLFLWFGRTKIEVSQQSVTVERELFGKVFQNRMFSRENVELTFEESHRDNDVPSYKLMLQDGKSKKVGVGGSLKEESLIWLKRELYEVLGKENEGYENVREAMSEKGKDQVYEAVVDPKYQSKNLRFERVMNGWEAQMGSTLMGAIGIIFFGSIFLIAGLVMSEVTRDIVLDWVPWVRDLFDGASSSGDGIPVWFSLVFGGAGLIVMLSGLFTMGYRVKIAKRHSSIHRERYWWMFCISDDFRLDELRSLEVKESGESNGASRYSLTAHFKSGKKMKIKRFGSAEDVGQLYARLNEEIKH